MELQFAPRLGEAVRIGERAQRRHEVRRPAHQLQVLRELKRFPFAYTGDQVFLGGKIDIQRAGADARFAADVLHAGTVKAPLHEEQAFGGIEDALAAGLLGLFV